MRITRSLRCWLALAALMAAVLPAVGRAQVVFEDGSSPAQDASGDSLVDVGDGRVVGRQVFFRFGQFDVHSGERVTYTNSTGASDPTTVFNAIFDVKPSSIDGAIASQYKADFFFLNSQGILFGPNATVDIGGSLFLSSADFVEFDNGEVFEVAAGGAYPSSPTAVPSAFGFLGGKPGDIGVSSDLRLSQGATLMLAGGDVTLEDARIRVADGTVFLQGLGSEGRLALDPDADTTSFSELGDVSIRSELQNPNGSPATSVNVSGSTGGLIRVRGRDVTLDDAVVNTGNTAARARPDAIDVEATGDVRIAGRSDLRSDTRGAFAGGDVSVRGDTVTLVDNARVRSVVRSGASGEGGRVEIAARSIDLAGEVEIGSTTAAGSSGKGGDVVVAASEQLSVLGDPSVQAKGITTRSEGSGAAGGIAVVTPELVVDGGEISTRASRGDGGNLRLDAGDTGRIIVRNGRIIASGTGGANVDLRAGVVALDATTLAAIATSPDGGNLTVRSPIFSAANSAVTATGTLDTDPLHDPLDNDLASRPVPLELDFLDPTALYRTRCQSPTSAPGASQLTALPRRGQNPTPEEPLLAFDAVDSGDTMAPESGRTLDARALEGDAEEQGRSAAYYESTDGYALQAFDALLGQGQALHLLGHPEAAVHVFERALEAARRLPGKVARARAGSSLANALVVLGQTERAGSVFESAVADARAASSPKVASGVLNNYGSWLAHSGDVDGALEAYRESFDEGAKARQRVRQAQSLANAARTALAAGRLGEARSLLREAHATAQAMPSNPFAAWIQIHLARSFERLARIVPTERETALMNAYFSLRRAAELAESWSDERAKSQALGDMARIYQQEDRIEEALLLSRRASAAAASSGDPSVRYRWQWLEGQLMRSAARPNAALSAYRRAIRVLETTRQETLARYGPRAAYFDRGIAPPYVEYVDLLLELAGRSDVGEAAPALLLEARATLELLKAAELRDYFRDDCIADLEARARGEGESDDRAAVVYPIALADRTELLVAFPSGLRRYSVPVGRHTLMAEARNLRARLQRPDDPGFDASSRQLYDWLVRPYAAALESASIDTLVLVPDGALRSIPLAALSDGEAFLVTRFATAVAPGVDLVEPRSSSTRKLRPLIGGLAQASQGYPALPRVSAELAGVQSTVGGEVLADDAFEVESVKRAIREDGPTIVHLASYTAFDADPERSFVLTHDGALTISDLAGALHPSEAAGHPVELLLLSASRAPADQDRAALGLAGVALQTGARSAVGSLWSPAGGAVSELVVAFYGELAKGGVSKARALQRAQLALHRQDAYRHPYYWSHFLLTGSWL